MTPEQKEQLENYYQERKRGAYATILRQYLDKCREVEELKKEIARIRTLLPQQ